MNGVVWPGVCGSGDVVLPSGLSDNDGQGTHHEAHEESVNQTVNGCGMRASSGGMDLSWTQKGCRELWRLCGISLKS